MARLRVCHLTFDMGIGGAEQVIRNLILHMAGPDFEFHVLCIEEPVGAFGEDLRRRGYSVSSMMRRQGFDVPLINKIRNFLLRQKIDILHCHQYTPWSYGVLATRATGIRVIFTEHGRFHPDRTSWKRRYVNPVLLRFTQCVTAISSATRTALTRFEYIPEHRIEVIYNGIHPLEVDEGESTRLRIELGLSRDTRVLGTVARLDPVKNQAMTLRAFKRVMDRCGDDIRLLIVGDGSEMNALKSRADSLGIRDCVIFTGFVVKPGNHMNLMEIFLLSSLTEGTSMTLLEAMSIGKPSVVTNAGGNPEIIEHGFNGLVAENDDDEDFARSIVDLLGNDELVATMGKNALRRFEERFTVEEMASRFERIYRQLVA